VGAPIADIRLGRRLRRIVLVVCLVFSIQPPAAPDVTLALLGDVMLGRGISAAGVTPSQVMSVLAPRTAPADLVLANLESPLTTAPAQSTSEYVLCAPPSQTQVLVAARLDLVSLANNHRLDCGESGLEETRARLLAAGIQPLGPEKTVVYRQVGPIRLAFLALDDVSDPIPLDSAVRTIAQARASGALVIVSVHWGAEYQSAPNARQRAIADDLIKAGASLVWGHHPHVLQPAERLDCDLPRGCAVLYSLGNAVFDQAGLADTRRAAVVRARLDKGGVIELRAIPFSIDVRRALLIEASADDASAVANRLGPDVNTLVSPASP
jgi:poly-gamma-glutamate capsule biosynthesis protein CapA/YwtB (metallophosphatase superfamily)